MKPRFLFVWAIVAAGVSFGCTAVSVSPPLSSRGVSPPPPQGAIALTSGQFRRAYEVVGVVQMTQSGYRWFHEVEVVSDANPRSILYKIGRYAHEHGADGIQFLELIDLEPQSPGAKAVKQINSAVAISEAARRGDPAAIADEGSKTRWEVRGELIRFVD
jgi:hypothetical protein